jgi:hypothetical protein
MKLTVIKNKATMGMGGTDASGHKSSKQQMVKKW